MEQQCQHSQSLLFDYVTLVIWLFIMRYLQIEQYIPFFMLPSKDLMTGSILGQLNLFRTLGIVCLLLIFMSVLSSVYAEIFQVFPAL
jgi:hypothetical protein